MPDINNVFVFFVQPPDLCAHQFQQATISSQTTCPSPLVGPQGRSLPIASTYSASQPGGRPQGEPPQQQEGQQGKTSYSPAINRHFLNENVLVILLRKESHETFSWSV